jgi:hypothetical protein
VRFSRLLPQVWVRLAVVTSRCSRIPSSHEGLIVVCSANREECAVGQPMAARLLLTHPGWPTDCTCRGRRNIAYRGSNRLLYNDFRSHGTARVETHGRDQESTWWPAHGPSGALLDRRRGADRDTPRYTLTAFRWPSTEAGAHSPVTTSQ